jgi:surface antigen
MFSPKARFILLMTATIGIAAPLAFSQAMRFLENGPARFFTDDDVKLATQTMKDALDNQSNGTTSDWNNPRSGNSGSATPTKTFTKRGMTCRRLKLVNRARGQTGQAVFNFCQQPDRTWKIVSD